MGDLVQGRFGSRPRQVVEQVDDVDVVNMAVDFINREALWLLRRRRPEFVVLVLRNLIDEVLRQGEKLKG